MDFKARRWFVPRSPGSKENQAFRGSKMPNSYFYDPVIRLISGLQESSEAVEKAGIPKNSSLARIIISRI